MGRRLLFPFLLVLTLVACSPDEKKETATETNLYKVVLFLNPDCPLCQSYSTTIKKLQLEFPNTVEWIAVFSGKWISKDSTEVFLSRYSLSFREVIFDRELELVNKYKAIITPSVYVLDKEGSIRYEGRIDDWAIETGVKKLKPTDFNLKNALDDLLNGREVRISKTTPIGCIIE